MRNLARDRRGIAAVEFAVVTPLLLVLVVAFIDMVQVGRGHLRVQSTATQIGQAISQCNRVSAGDETQLMNLAQRLLGPFASPGKGYAVVVTVIGRDAQNNAFTWPMQRTTSGFTAPVSLGSQLPPNITVGRNEAFFRTEVWADVDTMFFSSRVALLADKYMESRTPLSRASGSAFHMTRAPNVADLRTKRPSNAEECL